MIRASTRSPAIRSSPTATGSLKRRGPALPGLTNSTPSRVSTLGYVRMPEDHHPESRRNRIDVQFRLIVPDVD